MTPLDIPIYGGTVLFYTSREAYAKAHAKRSDREFDPAICDGVCSDFSGMIYMIGVFDGRLSTLVHETAHAAFKILRDVNVPVGADGNQEAFCFMQEWLFQQLRKGLK